MLNNYKNYISLGYFCSVAMDLEKLGLRSFSSPFDWCIAPFPGVIEALESKFDCFLEIDNLLQNTEYREVYKDEKYGFAFFHDFNKYVPLNKQYDKVHLKYQKRISRFFKAITTPALFIRYISSAKVDELGKSVELDWIEHNYDHILSVIKSFNPDNDIVFIGDESIKTDLFNIYHVLRDEGDVVCRTPIYNNEQLYSFLSTVNFENREKNLLFYEKKQKRKSNPFRKLFLSITSRFKKVYFHDKTYNG